LLGGFGLRAFFWSTLVGYTYASIPSKTLSQLLAMDASDRLVWLRGQCSTAIEAQEFLGELDEGLDVKPQKKSDGPALRRDKRSEFHVPLYGCARECPNAVYGCVGFNVGRGCPGYAKGKSK
jgi:hypothetical protein